MKAQFRYTFPIEKAEQRDDGMYIVGQATGPEIDNEGERMAPEAIVRFSQQIEEMAAADMPLVYRDAHMKDGVLMDLGVVTKAWMTPEWHLGVEVRLDEDNPAAVSLFKQIRKGKQFGMSVAGTVMSFVDEFVAEVGHIVRTYKDVVLREISNTTRPAWTPSLGSVLSKAIKDAASAESLAGTGDNLRMDEELQSAQETTEPAAEKSDELTDEVEETTEKAEDEENTTEAEAEKSDEAEEEETVEDAEKADEAAEEDETTEKAGRALSAANRAALKASYDNITETLRGLGVLDTEQAPAEDVEDTGKSVSEDEAESAIEKDDAESSDIAELRSTVEALQKSLDEATARIAELENSPAGDDAPTLVERHALTVEEVQKALNEMSPSERLRLGLRASYKS